MQILNKLKINSKSDLTDYLKDVNTNVELLPNETCLLKISYILRKNFDNIDDMYNYFIIQKKIPVNTYIHHINNLNTYAQCLNYLDALPNIPKSVTHYNNRTDKNKKDWVFDVIDKYYNFTEGSVKKAMLESYVSGAKGKKEGIIVKHYSYQNFYAVNIFGVTEGWFDVTENLLGGKQQGVIVKFNGFPTKEDLEKLFEIDDIFKPTINFNDDFGYKKAYDLKLLRDYIIN